MRVTLAYPFDGHEPDETIEVDDSVGRTLIRDGFARAPEHTPTNVTPDSGEED